ncbi:MAG: hypothetical protein V4597_20245 [Pseudomonadota bacterium]
MTPRQAAAPKASQPAASVPWIVLLRSALFQAMTVRADRLG